jgi:hypothetical protein
MSTEHFPAVRELELEVHWHADDSLEVKRQKHEQVFRQLIESIVQQLVDDGEARAELFEPLVDKFMRQCERAMAQHFAYHLGREAMH